MKITVLGDSTIWGNGLLHDNSICGVIDEFLHKGNTIFSEEMKFSSKIDIVNNKKIFREKAIKIKGNGSDVQFKFTGDKLFLCQVIERTSNYAQIEVFADNKLVGTFNNKNNTIGNDIKNFTANGEDKLFCLDRAFTYNHKVTVNGVVQKFTTYNLDYVVGEVDEYFKGYDGIVVRSNVNNEVKHNLLFFNAPSKNAKIECAYEYGETICYTKSSVGGTENEHNLESFYGSGNIAFDTLNVHNLNSGLDFRYTNNDAFVTFELNEYKTHNIKIKISNGKNPYFIINFASNKEILLQNAGIGGFTGKLLLNDRFGRSIYDSLKIFTPDIAFISLGANDDWEELERLVNRNIDNLTLEEVLNLNSMEYKEIIQKSINNYSAIKKSAIIENITPYSLSSKSIIDSNIKVGNFVRIGNYTGDNNSVAIRVISNVDTINGVISWKKPLEVNEFFVIDKLEELINCEYTVRTLESFSNNIIKMISILKRSNPNVIIGLFYNYMSNYFIRDLWGYREALQKIAQIEGNVFHIDSKNEVDKWIQSQITGKNYIDIEANNSNAYTLDWVGHWQGFKVLVDNVDVYGKDCYIKTNNSFLVEKLPDNNFLVSRTKRLNTAPLQLVFTKNIPEKGKNIRVIKGDMVWAADYTHPNVYGYTLVGNLINEVINEQI